MATSTITMPVPVIANPFTGLYGSPSPSSTATVSTNDKTIASTGERCFGWTRASAAGNAPIRPIANDIRDAMFTPALALPIVELTIARKTKNQNSPYSERAMPSQDAAPDDVNVANLSGPNATAAA